MPLKDKVAIISGASRGIGRAIAQELAGEGVHIAFSYLRNNQAAEELEKELCGLGVKAEATQVDIKDTNAVSGWVKETKDIFGRLDILVNNAGITNDKALMFMSRQDWQEVIDTNLNGVFNLTQAVITGFLKQRSGDIVNITSVSGITGIERQTNYSASKAGIIGFTKSLAKEVAKYNIRVNAVAPGFIQTEMLESLKEAHKKKMIENIPLGRFGEAQEVAKAVKFLLSEAANYITGQTIIIDGGLSINI
jgi:3-oxoacyl-[acyl-carrier protein] reductase